LSSLGYSGINLFQLALPGRAHALELGEIEEHLDHLIDRHGGGIEVLQQLDQELLDDAQVAEEFGRRGHERMFAHGYDNYRTGTARHSARRI